MDRSGSSLTSHTSPENSQVANITATKDRSRARSWVQHPAPVVYPQGRRPPTPPNIMRERGTSRPTLARFGESLYPENNIGDARKDITIPRVLSYDKTPQNTNIRTDLVSESDSSVSSKSGDVSAESLSKGPVIMYTELQFPPNPSQVQIYSNKKNSTNSNVTNQKLSAEINRFEQSITRSRGEFYRTKDHMNDDRTGNRLTNID